MRLTRRVRLLAVAVVAALAVYAGISFTREPGIGACAPRVGWGPASEQDKRLVRQIEAGTRRASGAVRSGTGTATIYEWRQDQSGCTVEQETRCKVAFAGERFKIDYAEAFKRAASPRDPLNQRAGRFLRRLVNRAYSNQTLDNGIGAFDGKTVTVYRPNDGNAVESTAVRPGWIEHSEAVSACRGPRPIREGFREAQEGGLVQTGGPIRVLGRERVDGKDCVVVEQERKAIYRGSVRARVIARLWVCPELSYAVPRSQDWYRSPHTGSYELCRDSRTTFRKCGRGLWAPARVESVWYLGQVPDSPTRRTRVTYEPGFRLNVPARSLDLKLRLPSGIKVFNLETGGFRKVP